MRSDMNRRGGYPCFFSPKRVTLRETLLFICFLLVAYTLSFVNMFLDTKQGVL